MTTHPFLGLVAFALTAGLVHPASARIASYHSLKEAGYTSSRLTKNIHSGVMGWYMTGARDKYFCRMQVGWYRGGKTGVGVFSTGGPMPLHPSDTVYKMFVSMVGPPRGDEPLLNDLLEGRPRSGKDVTNCETTH